MGKILVCGIGNKMRGDDAAGPLVIESLRGKTEAVLLDCGEAPENYLGKIEVMRPEKIIIVDAVDMDKPYGTVEEISIDRIRGAVMSSHHIPLTLFLEYLRSRVKARMVFVGIQPKNIEFNTKPSKECLGGVRRAAKSVLKLINHE